MAHGISVDGTSRNTLVGGVIPLGNVTACNNLNGIDVLGPASNFVTFNTFGGLLAFKGAAPNGNDGLLITATGGNNVARTNVFSGNSTTASNRRRCFWGYRGPQHLRAHDQRRRSPAQWRQWTPD